MVIQSINPTTHWLVTKIKSLHQELFTSKLEFWDEGYFSTLRPFVKEFYWNSQASINVFRVKGTQHPDYQGLTWIEFLETGKRMPLNLSLFEQNPDYYLTCSSKQPTMFYQGINGGHLYIGGDGNHRTAIARAYFYIEGRNVLHGVDLKDYRIDWEMRHVFGLIQEVVALRKLSYIVEPHQRPIKRIDSGSWMEEKYEVLIKVKDLNKREEFLLDIKSAYKFLEDIKKAKWRRFLSFSI